MSALRHGPSAPGFVRGPFQRKAAGDGPSEDAGGHQSSRGPQGSQHRRQGPRPSPQGPCRPSCHRSARPHGRPAFSRRDPEPLRLVPFRGPRRGRSGHPRGERARPHGRVAHSFRHFRNGPKQASSVSGVHQRLSLQQRYGPRPVFQSGAGLRGIGGAALHRQHPRSLRPLQRRLRPGILRAAPQAPACGRSPAPSQDQIHRPLRGSGVHLGVLQSSRKPRHGILRPKDWRGARPREDN